MAAGLKKPEMKSRFLELAFSLKSPAPEDLFETKFATFLETVCAAVSDAAKEAGTRRALQEVVDPPFEGDDDDDDGQGGVPDERDLRFRSILGVLPGSVLGRLARALMQQLPNLERFMPSRISHGAKFIPFAAGDFCRLMREAGVPDMLLPPPGQEGTVAGLKTLLLLIEHPDALVVGEAVRRVPVVA